MRLSWTLIAISLAAFAACQARVPGEPQPTAENGTCGPVAGEPGAEQTCVFVPDFHECRGAGGTGPRCQIAGKVGECGEIWFDNDGDGLDGLEPGGDRQVPDLDMFRKQMANFRGAQLRGAKINGLLAFADFEGANLDGADFSGADLPGASFRNANLTSSKFGRTRPDQEVSAIPFTDFRGATMTYAVLNGTNLTASRFDGARIDYAMFQSIKADHAVFDGAIAHNSDFRYADMAFASFVGTHVEGSYFDFADLRFSDLRNMIGAASADYAQPSQWHNAVVTYAIACGASWGPASTYTNAMFYGTWHQDVDHRVDYWERWGMAYAPPDKCAAFKTRTMTKLDATTATPINTELIRICANSVVTGGYNVNNPCENYRPSPDLQALLDTGLFVPLWPKGGSDHVPFDKDMYGLIVGAHVIGYQKVMVVEWTGDRGTEVRYKDFNARYATHYAPVRSVPTTVHPKQLVPEEVGVWNTIGDVSATFVLHLIPGGGTAYMLAFENPHGDIWKRGHFWAQVAMDVAAFASMGSNAAAASATGLLKREIVGIASNQSIAVGTTAALARRLTWSHRLRVVESVALAGGIAANVPELARDVIKQDWARASGDAASMLMGMYFLAKNLRSIINIRSARNLVADARRPYRASDFPHLDVNVQAAIEGFPEATANWAVLAELRLNEGRSVRAVFDELAELRRDVQRNWNRELFRRNQRPTQAPEDFGQWINGRGRLLHPISSLTNPQNGPTKLEIAREARAMLDAKGTDRVIWKYTRSDGTVVDASRVMNAKKVVVVDHDGWSERLWNPELEADQWIVVTSPMKDAIEPIFNDAVARIEKLVARQVPGGTQAQLEEFANATYGYFHGIPFARGGDSIGKPVLAGAYHQIFGERLTWVGGTDMRAMTMCQEDFVAWFIKNIAHP